MAQTGQSEAIHSPEACASTVVRLTMPAVWSMRWSARSRSHAGLRSCGRCRARSTAGHSGTTVRPRRAIRPDRRHQRFLRVCQFRLSSASARRTCRRRPALGQPQFGDQFVRDFQGIARPAKRWLEAINAAHRLDDLLVPPSNRLEKLKGNMKGFFSIRINDQWRVIFQWVDSYPMRFE